jgi:hypothetical protein
MARVASSSLATVQALPGTGFQVPFHEDDMSPFLRRSINHLCDAAPAPGTRIQRILGDQRK